MGVGVVNQNPREHNVHLQSMQAEFGVFRDGGAYEFADFDAYVAWMRQPQSWGDNLSLVAMASILMRPIHVISDHLNRWRGRWNLSLSSRGTSDDRAAGTYSNTG